MLYLNEINVLKLKRFFLFFATSFIALSCNNTSIKLAEIDVSKNQNFGDVKVGDTAQVSFQIRNSSNIPLHVKGIESSCGCTVANLKDTLITKDETTIVEVAYIARESDTGRVQKAIVIDTNTNPNFTVLYIEGNVSNN